MVEDAAPSNPVTVVLDTPTVPPTSTMPIIVSAGVIACATLCSITLLTIYHPGDNTQLIASIVGFGTLSMTSLIAILKSNANANAIQKLHLAVNGRLTQLLESMTANAALKATNATLIAKADDKAVTESQTGIPAAVKLAGPATIVINSPPVPPV